MLIVGEKEIADSTVSVRSRDDGDAGVYTVTSFIATIQDRAQ